jgi:hypothetical protein
MTEIDWQSSQDPLAMYRLLRESTTLMRTRWQGWVPVRRFHFSVRSETLFRCAVADRLMDIVGSPAARQVIDHLRKEHRTIPPQPQFGQMHAYNAFLLDSRMAREGAVGTAWQALLALLGPEENRRGEGLFLAAVAQAERAAGQGDLWQRARVMETEKVAQVELLREFAGNPFHTPHLPEGWERWDEGLIRAMAERVDREDDFQAVPVLGDALEDAGCTDATILAHCRATGQHQRGCWVLELLLGHE